jgi:hypothetical protein
MSQREPDFYIGGKEDPYMLRWWAIPRNKWFNIYVHRILKSDRDEALHDHPWINCSLLVFGSYEEVTILPGGVHHVAPLAAGNLRARLPTAAHRLVKPDDENKVVTIFVTGPVWRHWGFHCAKGWRHWKDFVGFRDEHSNVVGRGCGEMDDPGLPGGRISLFSSLLRSSDARPR